SAVAGNSDHWSAARAGVDGVSERLRAAVDAVSGAEFRGRFPDAVLDGHERFLSRARDFGASLHTPGSRLQAAAPRIDDLRTRFAAAGGWGRALQIPAITGMRLTSARLAALMESVYVPAVEQASTIPVLPGPVEDGAGRGGSAAVRGDGESGQRPADRWPEGGSPRVAGDTGGEHGAAPGSAVDSAAEEMAAGGPTVPGDPPDAGGRGGPTADGPGPEDAPAGSGDAAGHAAAPVADGRPVSAAGVGAPGGGPAVAGGAPTNGGEATGAMRGPYGGGTSAAPVPGGRAEPGGHADFGG